MKARLDYKMLFNFHLTNVILQKIIKCYLAKKYFNVILQKIIQR